MIDGCCIALLILLHNGKCAPLSQLCFYRAYRKVLLRSTMPSGVCSCDAEDRKTTAVNIYSEKNSKKSFDTCLDDLLLLAQKLWAQVFKDVVVKLSPHAPLFLFFCEI